MKKFLFALFLTVSFLPIISSEAETICCKEIYSPGKSDTVCQLIDGYTCPIGWSRK